MTLLALLSGRCGRQYFRKNTDYLNGWLVKFIKQCGLVVITEYLTNGLFWDDPIPCPYQPIVPVVRLEDPSVQADLFGDT